jgi:hypothetical protein
MSKGVIAKVSGPLVVATGLPEAKMFDVVRVGKFMERNYLYRFMKRLQVWARGIR